MKLRGTLIDSSATSGDFCSFRGPACQLMKRFLLCVLVASWPLASYSDEPVRSVQEELRRRNIYFGDVDGRRTPEFEEAVKRYQKRKGLPSSGSEDRETLRSLKLLAREPGEAPPREIEWPDEPVLKSDAKINVAEEAERISEETGVASESVAPILVAELPGRTPFRAAGRFVLHARLAQRGL